MAQLNKISENYIIFSLLQGVLRIFAFYARAWRNRLRIDLARSVQSLKIIFFIGLLSQHRVQNHFKRLTDLQIIFGTTWKSQTSFAHASLSLAPLFSWLELSLQGVLGLVGAPFSSWALRPLILALSIIALCAFIWRRRTFFFFLKIFSLDRHISCKSSKCSDWTILRHFGHLIPQFFMIARPLLMEKRP